MVSSFSRSCSTARNTSGNPSGNPSGHSFSSTSGNSPGNPSDSTLIGIDTLTHLPGSVALPPVYSDEPFVSQKHEVNPALALNLLSDIQSVILDWQEQLRQLVNAMNTLESQGPMVEGWLECSAGQRPLYETNSEAHSEAYNEAHSYGGANMTGAEKTLLRHGDTDALMQYVNSLDTQPQQQSPARYPEKYPIKHTAHRTPEQRTPDPLAQYRLCHLDAEGKVTSKPCPAEQMGMVSLAIARHQNFKQLLSQKQAIEAKLQKAVDQLTGVRGTLHHID